MKDRHRCRAIECKTLVPFGYLMCAFHWRLVPAEVKTIWRTTYFLEERTPGWREAASENLAEMLRITRAVELGVAA